ncbi:hypothetical protein E2C01_065932 [Portunus trituberculatus]|uniref:Uncharacterized protein n=1 Tax=Portunus trituberculatus TaxID=210409 RepID=A0A5B7HSJ2_PORTR|nr:hypothetical protein [Portunus trituberculatus]
MTALCATSSTYFSRQELGSAAQHNAIRHHSLPSALTKEAEQRGVSQAVTIYCIIIANRFRIAIVPLPLLRLRRNSHYPSFTPYTCRPSPKYSMLYVVVSCLASPRLALPRLALPRLASPCLTLPCLVLSCFVFSVFNYLTGSSPPGSVLNAQC